MPLLDVRQIDNSFTEYRVIADPSNAGLICLGLSLSACAVLLYGGYHTWIQAAAGLLVLISAYSWAFATQYESVMLIKGFVIQLQSRSKCGLCSTVCYDVTLVKDVLICEHVTTTDVYYYLAFKMVGEHNMVVAYQSLLPRLAVLKPAYQCLLRDMFPPLPARKPTSSCAGAKNK